MESQVAAFAGPFTFLGEGEEALGRHWEPLLAAWCAQDAMESILALQQQLRIGLSVHEFWP